MRGREILDNNDNTRSSPALTRYITPISAWALSFGYIVGWGAFVMPGTTFLPMSGPLGTAIGMIVGALVIMVIGVNYRYMMRFCPDAGGTFTYAKVTFGNDHGFLSAWFMILAYFSILWANVTALALIGRSVFGNALMFGYMYTIAGYDVYLGEVLVELAVMVLFSVVCMTSKRAAAILQTIFAGCLLFGIIAGFIIVMNGGNNAGNFLSPSFVPDTGISSQILGIVALAPWAFVGFESVSNSAEEFKFPIKRILVIMLSAIAAGAAAYILLGWVASSCQPEVYSSWAEYIRAAGSLGGVEGIPVFFAMKTAGGDAGMIILGISLVSAILTGIIGSTTASSRLLYSMSKENIIPQSFGKLTKNGIPRNAAIFLLAISAVIPFLGRTAIGWVVDVITVGTTIAYGYTSAAAFVRARHNGNKSNVFRYRRSSYISIDRFASADTRSCGRKFAFSRILPASGVLGNTRHYNVQDNLRQRQDPQTRQHDRRLGSASVPDILYFADVGASVNSCRSTVSHFKCK